MNSLLKLLCLYYHQTYISATMIVVLSAAISSVAFSQFFLSACRIKLVGRHISKSFVQGSDMQCSLPSSCIKLVAHKQHCRHVVQNEDKKDAHPPAHPQNSQRSNPISSLSYRYHAHHISPLPCTGRVGSVGRGQHVAITSCRLSNLAITCCHPTPPL